MYQIVCFKYSGGSKPGEFRHVIINEPTNKENSTWVYSSKHLEGYCVERNEYRKFRRDLIVGLRDISNVKTVDIDGVGSDLVREIVQSFEKRNYDTCIYDHTLFVFKKYDPSPKWGVVMNRNVFHSRALAQKKANETPYISKVYKLEEN